MYVKKKKTSANKWISLSARSVRTTEASKAVGALCAGGMKTNSSLLLTQKSCKTIIWCQERASSWPSEGGKTTNRGGGGESFVSEILVFFLFLTFSTANSADLPQCTFRFYYMTRRHLHWAWQGQGLEYSITANNRGTFTHTATCTERSQLVYVEILRFHFSALQLKGGGGIFPKW